MNNTCSENVGLVTQMLVFSGDKSNKMENVGNYTNCRNTVILSHRDSYVSLKMTYILWTVTMFTYKRWCPQI